MKRIYQVLGASSMLLAMAFIQCTSSSTSQPEGTADKDAGTAVMVKEPESFALDVLIDIPSTVVPSSPVAKPITDRNSASHVLPKPVGQPVKSAPHVTASHQKTVELPKPVDPPAPVVRPRHTEATVSFTSTGFALKRVKATIQGTSTLHDWESKVTEVSGKGTVQMKDQLITTIQDAEINIVVKGIQSEEGSKMDNKTYEAFKADVNPLIVYSFKDALVKISDSKMVTIEATGHLRMAGTTRSMTLTAKGKELSNGDLQLSVSKTIKMTDFGMEPPVMFLGTIKVGNDITVQFDFVLEKSE